VRPQLVLGRANGATPASDLLAFYVERDNVIWREPVVTSRKQKPLCAPKQSPHGVLPMVIRDGSPVVCREPKQLEFAA
jgi:hypothetical protein